MVLFAAVVRDGSFTKAAQHLGVTKQSVSERLAKLEEKLGVRLLERTTRRLRVTDAGPGIPADQLEAVFEPFYRLEESRNRHTGGAGLGLYIARELTLRQRGSGSRWYSGAKAGRSTRSWIRSGHSRARHRPRTAGCSTSLPLPAPSTYASHSPDREKTASKFTARAWPRRVHA